MAGKIGDSPRRKEDYRLLCGRGNFADDNRADRQLHAYMISSVHAHAEILGIDKGPAILCPGVVSILTGADWFADGYGPIPHDMGFASPPDIALENRDGSDRFIAPHFPLPVDRVRFVGQPVAMIVAETLEQAKDAAEHVEIKYKVLPPIINTADAADKKSVTVWSDRGSNVAIDADVNNPVTTAAALSSAAHVVKLRTQVARVSGVPLEPRSALGEFDLNGRYILKTSAGSIYRYKRELATMFSEQEENIRVIIGDVGGSYGPRNALYPEHPLVLWAAKKLGRPVKWISERTETMLTDFQARDLLIDASIGFDDKGKIVAFHATNTSNLGAYSASWIPLVKGIEIFTSLYRIPIASARAVAVHSNTSPTYPYRSAGRPEVMYAMERMMDMASLKTGIDRIEIRRRNVIPSHALPYQNSFGLTYDSGDYLGSLEEAVKLSDWDGFSRRREQSKKSGKLRGIGIANYADLSTGYPREWAAIEIKPEGRVDVIVGTMATGQGHQTTFSQIVAEFLQIPYEAIEVSYGDTDFLKDGGGSHAGRSMRMGGIALSNASSKILDKATLIAAQLLEVADADISYTDGCFTVIGTDRNINIFDVAVAGREQLGLPEHLKGQLREEADVFLAGVVIGSGCHVCELEVDPDTGQIKIIEWTAVDDVGRAINPMSLEGQTHGGVMQGVGQALMESCAYDDDTGQMVAASLMDYAMPRAEDSPAFRTKLLEVPSPSNPLGVKPGSEGGTAVAVAAVSNAIFDALGDYNVKTIDLPVTSERIWKAING